MSKQGPFEEWRILAPEEVARIAARKQRAIREAQGKPGTRTQHVRLSIDFHITIAGEPPDDDGMNEPDPVYHAQQARLLAAVKCNPSVLKQWMDHLIVGQMHQHNWYDWDMLTGGEVSLQDILAPALAALSEDDQAYFAEVAQSDYFDDMIDLFSASFTITEDLPVIRDQGDKA
jgi:hypothetical protein